MNTRNNTRLIQKKDLIEFWGRDFVYKEKLKFFLFQQEELKKKLPLVDTYQGATVFVSLHGRRQLMPLYAECGLLKIKNFRGDILAIAEKSGSGLFFYYQEDFVEMYFKRYKSICQHSAKDVIVDYLYFNDDSIRGYEYKQIILRDKKFAFIQDMLSMMFNILDYKYVIKELKACRVKKHICNHRQYK